VQDKTPLVDGTKRHKGGSVIVLAIDKHHTDIFYKYVQNVQNVPTRKVLRTFEREREDVIRPARRPLARHWPGQQQISHPVNLSNTLSFAGTRTTTALQLEAFLLFV
jgi:hypothetical protein